jgi:hypothetical protein
MRSSQHAFGPRRRIWARTAAVAVAGVGAVGLLVTPSQAVAVPPPGGHPVEVIETFIDPGTGQPIGEIVLVPCPGQSATPGWGVHTGPAIIHSLPCPQPPGPFPV